MSQTTAQPNEKTVKEIKTDHYALTYASNEDGFVCSDCNTEKDGLHMEHSIFFEKFTDVAPMCMDCVTLHQMYFT